MRTFAKIKRKAAKRQIKKEPLIVFATLQEALPSIEKLEAHPLIKDELFAFSYGHILISGIGALSSAIKVTTYSYLADEIWNLGIAATLSTHPLFSLFPVQTISKLLPSSQDTWSQTFSQDIHPPFQTKNPGLRLLTSDAPLHDASMKSTLSTSFDLVDMEGYGIAFAAHLNSKPLFIWKCISDFADNPTILHQNLSTCALTIASFLSYRISI